MSDNTTDTPETNVDGVEPSMEDILASIRRIIADDDQANAEFTGNMPIDSIAEVVEIPAPQAPAPQPVLEAVSDAPQAAELETLELQVEDMAQEEIASEELIAEELIEEEMALTPLDLAVGDETSDLEALEGMEALLGDDDLSGLEDLLADDDAPVVDNKSDGSQRLTGLAGLAAAGFGAAAAAGSGVAKAIKSERQTPVPDTAGGAQSDEAGDIMSLIEDNETEMEDLDLVLDDLTAGHHDQADDLEALLEIPNDPAEDEPIDDLARLLNNMLGDSPAADSEPEDEFVIDPAADLIAETADEEGADADEVDDFLSELMGEDEGDEDGALELHGETEDISEAQSDPDLDLVKSLMADLTDDPYPEAAASDEADDDHEDNVIDEILELSMEDEESLQQSEDTDMDIADLAVPLSGDDAPVDAAAAQDNAPFFIDINADLSKPETAKSSLSDIANSAKAEAERIKNKGFSTGQFAAGAGVAVAASGPLAALVKKNNGPKADAATHTEETAAADNIQELKPSEAEAAKPAKAKADKSQAAPKTAPKSKKTKATPSKETADMPKASAKETIVDNATEDATASAFASLNKVIDEKATMADRGDRIGDLVQEALRPMLKEWLDKNLKGIVERAVTKEVKRISSGK